MENSAYRQIYVTFFLNNDKLLLSVAYNSATSLTLCNSLRLFRIYFQEKYQRRKNLQIMLTMFQTLNWKIPYFREFEILQGCLSTRNTQHFKTYLCISKYHIYNNFKRHINCSFLVGYAYRLAAFQGKHSRNDRSVTWQASKQKKKNAVALRNIYKCFIPTRSGRNSSISGHEILFSDCYVLVKMEHPK